MQREPDEFQRCGRHRFAVNHDGFIKVAVTKTTREGLNNIKTAMGVRSQAAVIEKLVAIGMAIHRASRYP